MSTPTAAALLAHRSVANIRAPSRAEESRDPSSSTTTTATTTPLRGLSAFTTPSSLRADEEIIIVELGTRKLHIGFSGDALPRGTVWFGPDQLRRVGDFREWQAGYRYDWRSETAGGRWGRDYELWRFDVRGVDLGLVGDRVERALREGFTKYMLIDSRPRRMIFVLPSGLPIPLLSAALDSVFTRFQPPTISLLSSPLAITVGAGVRSALVVDLGWSETVVTAVYEYREVSSRRSIRGGRMLVENTHRLLASYLPEPLKRPSLGQDHVLSFEECSDVTNRMVWCRPRPGAAGAAAAAAAAEQQVTQTPSSSSSVLPTVPEHEEPPQVQEPTPSAEEPTIINIPLTSCARPVTVSIPFDAFSDPCEETFFDSQYAPASFDDHELPIPLLVYRSLLQLPLDVRAVCMARIIFTGGCANVLGLRGRIFDEVSHLVRERGWDPVQGRGVEQYKKNTKLKRGPPVGQPPRQGTPEQQTQPQIQITTPSGGSRESGEGESGERGQEQDGIWQDSPARDAPQIDPIDEQLKRQADKTPKPVQGQLRAIESVGAWSGASLITHFKAPALAVVEKDQWLQHGVAGASKPGEVEHQVMSKSTSSHRQSLGGGLGRGSGGAWTLGIWGAV